MLKIAFIGQPEYFQFMYENELEDFADVFKFKFEFGLNASQFKDLIDFQADYNFFFRGEFLPEVVLEQLKGVRVALSSEPFPRLVNGRYAYTSDSVQRYLCFRQIRHKPFDYIFHYDAASLPFFERDRLFVSGEFPFPVATGVYYPREESKIWDVFFIGRSTAHRESYFGFLKHHYEFLHICHGIWGEPLVNYLCGSRICVNVHAEDEVSWEPRMQMMMACGSFVISERITPNPYLRPGVDYVEISSPQELHEAVEYFLQHNEERLKIAQSGFERVRSLLDSKTNFKKLISDIEGKKYRKFTAERGAIYLNWLAKASDVLVRFKK